MSCANGHEAQGDFGSTAKGCVYFHLSSYKKNNKKIIIIKQRERKEKKARFSEVRSI
jgi:hypothetical protein